MSKFQKLLAMVFVTVIFFVVFVGIQRIESSDSKEINCLQNKEAMTLKTEPTECAKLKPETGLIPDQVADFKLFLQLLKEKGAKQIATKNNKGNIESPGIKNLPSEPYQAFDSDSKSCPFSEEKMSYAYGGDISYGLVSASVAGYEIIVTATSYAPLDPRAIEGMCYSGDPNITATGATSRIGDGSQENPYIIAVDPTVIPLGSDMIIKGMGWGTAQDVGGMIKGNRIDVMLGCQDEAIQFGRQEGIKVFVLQN